MAVSESVVATAAPQQLERDAIGLSRVVGYTAGFIGPAASIALGLVAAFSFAGSATPFVVFVSDVEEVWVYYNAEWHHELDVAFRDPSHPEGQSTGIDVLLTEAGLRAEPAESAVHMPSSEGQLDAALRRRAGQVRQLITRRGSERRD